LPEPAGPAVPSTQPRTVAIVQARMGSTRLPGKVLTDLAGEPMLTRIVQRLQGARTLHDVVVATTTAQRDDAIEDLCRQHRWPCYRGSEEDALDRYYRAAIEARAEVIVRITADCPLIDPELVDQVVEALRRSRPAADYASNNGFPIGLDVEVVRFAALQRAWQEDPHSTWREHVTVYLYRHPELFRLITVSHDVDLRDTRWTVDTTEDLAFVRHIYEHFGDRHFSWRDVLELLQRHPDWQQINRHIRQRQV